MGLFLFHEKKLKKFTKKIAFSSYLNNEGQFLERSKKMYFISQTGKQDCAFACLKMMLANYHRDKNYIYLPCENKSYSFQDLIDIGSHYNTTLLGIKIESPQELYKCKKFPIVVTLNKKKGLKHSVLLLSANAKYVSIYDPELGKRKISTELFLTEWTGKALIVKEMTRTKCPETFPDFINKNDKIILPITQLLSGISLLIGTYFLSDSFKIYLPLIFMVLFVTFEVLFRWTLVGAMRRMDDIISGYTFNLEKEQYVDLFKDIEKYRKIALTITPNFIYSCMITIFVIVVLMINSLINVIFVMVPLMLAFIQVFLFNPYFNEKKLVIEEKESELADVENDYQFKMKSSEVHNIAYKTALNSNAYFYFEVAMLLLSIVLTMVVTKTFNITYVVFYLCITLFLKSNFAKLFELPSQSEEYDRTLAKLINVISTQNNN